jgi:hypothetical protein
MDGIKPPLSRVAGDRGCLLIHIKNI